MNRIIFLLITQKILIHNKTTFILLGIKTGNKQLIYNNLNSKSDSSTIKYRLNKNNEVE